MRLTCLYYNGWQEKLIEEYVDTIHSVADPESLVSSARMSPDYDNRQVLQKLLNPPHWLSIQRATKKVTHNIDLTVPLSPERQELQIKICTILTSTLSWLWVDEYHKTTHNLTSRLSHLYFKTNDQMLYVTIKYRDSGFIHFRVYF